MTGGIDLFAMKGVSSSSRLTEDMGSSFLKCVGSLDLPPFCQTGKRGKKVLQTILASLYTAPSSSPFPFPLPPLGHCPYGKSHFKKGLPMWQEIKRSFKKEQVEAYSLSPEVQFCCRDLSAEG